MITLASHSLTHLITQLQRKGTSAKKVNCLIFLPYVHSDQVCFKNIHKIFKSYYLLFLLLLLLLFFLTLCLACRITALLKAFNTEVMFFMEGL